MSINSMGFRLMNSSRLVRWNGTNEYTEDNFLPNQQQPNHDIFPPKTRYFSPVLRASTVTLIAKTSYDFRSARQPTIFKSYLEER